MAHMKDAKVTPWKRILLVGPTGSGKTTQLWTLPGRQFLYQFDPNTIPAIKGVADQLHIDPPDIEFEPFEPDFLEMDATLKGFNKGSSSDTPDMVGRPKKQAEPTVYMDWVEDMNRRVDEDFFAKEGFNWLCFDGLTFITRAVMSRNLFINGKYGDIEDKSDYRVVGSKLTEVFASICSLPINIFMTAHTQTYVDEKTSKKEVLLKAMGSSRDFLPTVFTEIWEAVRGEDKNGNPVYQIRTRPDPRGLQSIRSSIQGLEEFEDVTIDDFSKAQESGIGAILADFNRRK